MGLNSQIGFLVGLDNQASSTLDHLIQMKQDTGQRLVGCGQCRQCRIRRKQAWVGRMRIELDQALGLGRWLTLTYAENPGLLDYQDLKLWLKRYRDRYKLPTRFFACGEYGDTFGRGHWHVCIFGHGNYQDKPGLVSELTWKHGNVFEGQLNLETIGYTAGYTMKWNYETAYTPITRMSLKPGLALPYIQSIGAQFARHFTKKSPVSLLSSYRYSGQIYPLYGGGRLAFEKGYINAGGLPPVEKSPMELSLETAIWNREKLRPGGFRDDIERREASLLQRVLTNGKASPFRHQ